MNEILAALIGGIATLLGALISIKRETSENDETAKNPFSWKLTGLFVIGCFAGGLLYAVIERNIDTTLFAGGLKITPGTIVAYAGPMNTKNKSDLEAKGWLLCDGSLVDKNGKYKLLYDAIGDNWGPGDGASQFSLPDLEGMFLRGVDPKGKNDPDATKRIDARGQIGPNVGSLQGDAFLDHQHNMTDGKNLIQVAADPSSLAVAILAGERGGVWGPGAPTLGATKGAGLETRPKNIYVYYIVKY